MTTFDYPDFTQPVAAQNKAATVLDSFLIKGALHTGILDVTQWGELAVSMVLPATAAGSRYTLRADWSDLADTIAIATDQISFHSEPSYQFADDGFWRIPVKGPGVQFWGTGTDNTDGTTISVSGTSLSPGGRGLLFRSPTQDDRLQANAGPTIAGAGGTVGPIYVPPCTEGFNVSWSWAIAAGTLDINGVYKNGASAASVRLAKYTITGPSNGPVFVQAPNIGCELTFTNNDAGPHTGSYQVWDVSR